MALQLQRVVSVQFLKAIVVAAALAGWFAPASAQIDRTPYAPFEFLIGAWEVSDGSGRPFAIHRFTWAAGRSYMVHSGSVISGGVEQPQFEGVLMWNGVDRRLDLLISTDLRYGLSQQQGSIRVAENGELVREITAIFSPGVSRGADPPAGLQGATQDFRQTYRLIAPGRMSTAVLRRVDDHWEPTHPGSENWVMTRRPG